MAVKTIFLIGNKKLREVSRPVDFNNDPVENYINDLRDTLLNFQEEKKIGRAIAAPQIGLPKRVIYMQKGDVKYIMINPVITYKSNQMFEVWDSCFSAEVAFFGKTLRHNEISVEYFNEKGEKFIDNFTGDLAELFQHEIDHLDGILFTDRIINNQIIMRSEWEKLNK